MLAIFAYWFIGVVAILELRAWGSFRTGRPSWPSDSWCLDPKAFAAVILFARSDKTVWPRCGFCALEVLPGDLTNCQSQYAYTYIYISYLIILE